MKTQKINYEKVIDQLRELLPHGSGIDCAWTFDVLANGKIRASNSFHCMSRHGYYDGYADFTLTFDVRAPLQDFRLAFNGSFSQYKARHYMLREYLEDTIFHSLPAVVSVSSLGGGITLCAP